MMANSRKSFEGQLYKYTNVMKGWQYRWFILHSDTGVLSYYMPDDTKRQRPRGAVKLSGAVISPSDEDSQTFSVSFATGDTFKLRAADAKERQLWVNELRTITQKHTQPLGQQNISRRADNVDGPSNSNLDLFNLNNEIMMFPSATCASEAINDVKSIVLETELHHEGLMLIIESLPYTGENMLSSLDKDLLLMKATSKATLSCLEQCFLILSRGFCSVTDKRRKSVKSLSVSSSVGYRSSSGSSIPSTVTPIIPPLVPDNEELTDEEMSSVEENCPIPEDNKNIILFSLSQLKLGMDLTKVTLPTFILEPFSLLEMYSDFFGHPNFFVEIVDFPTPQERMISVLKWYLTAFHIGRPKSVARKPYNPLLGETFQCSWRTKSDKKYTTKDPLSNEEQDVAQSKVNFVAEQVSHHPPTSAFYMECVDKQLYVNGHLSTRSKFMGMSIGVNIIGEVVLCDMRHNEEYIMTVPNVHAHSILSVPWVEFRGKVTIMSNSGYVATAIFHTKPFYGGKLHRVTAEVKTSSGEVLCKVNGEWNGLLEFAFNDGTADTIISSNLVKTKKRIQDIASQSKLDSRNVWQNVSSALREGDVTKATHFKQELEESQRVDEKLRKSGQETFQTQFFQKDDDGKWIYRRLVKGDIIGK